MLVPGNVLNHNLEPNTVYQPPENGTAEGIDLVVLCGIRNGEKRFHDFRRHGRAPK